MQELIANPVFQMYVISTVLLTLNLVFLANATAVTRAGANEVINPEDVRLNKVASVVFDGGNDQTYRFRRAHRNALENIPMFMITSALLPLTGATTAVAGVLFASFVVIRWVHSFCYIKAIQPFRTGSHGVTAVLQLVTLGVVLFGVFM